MAQRSGASGRHGKRTPPTIKAAGGVVWRDGSGGREVLAVHRPRYDDWSLPKGKLKDREPAALAAVREILEETGWRVRLGPELPTVRYQFGGVPKAVRFWLANPIGDVPFIPNDEVDETAWVGLEEAKRRFQPTDWALVRSAVPRAHPASPLVVVRHARSMRRKEWPDDDRDRPLSRDGHAQSSRIAALLVAWAPARVVTSTSRRCRDTVAPFAEVAQLELELSDALSEEAFEKDPMAARQLVADLRASGEPAVVCTHRPLLATVARTIGLDLPKNARSNPLRKGGIWVAHPGRAAHRVERHTA